jgi:hypothetical protein
MAPSIASRHAFLRQRFSQRARVEYLDTFSPVVKLSTLRAVLSIAAKRNSAEIETTFVNADLQNEIYMR